jgi:hypothetical protein
MRVVVRQMSKILQLNQGGCEGFEVISKAAIRSKVFQ